MRTLEQALMDHDLLTLRVMGEWWELDLIGADKTSCVKALTGRLSSLDLLEEINYLEQKDAQAMQALVQAGGRVPVATFGRTHGEVRQMGANRLEREEPWLAPVSPAEALWYKGFLFRGFDETEEGLVEFYFLPEELFAQFPQEKEQGKTPDTQVEKVAPPETAIPAGSSAVDDFTTLLAFAQRDGLPTDAFTTYLPYLQDDDLLRSELLLTIGVELEHLRPTDEGLKPSRTAVSWLKEGREKQLRTLAEAWLVSSWNELCHTPGLRCEGSGWTNDPRLARQALLQALPRSTDWFSLDSLVQKIKENNPDFQRPDGDYDSWYIRDLESDAFITGFTNWMLVEGRLLHFLLQGPLHWLGMVDLGENSVRLSERGLAWQEDKDPAGHDIDVPIVVQADASLLVPYNAGRYQRFQAARFADPQPYAAGKPYLYQISPRSLQQAQEAGIHPPRVLEFLETASQRKIPASTRRAIERWQEQGLEGRLEPVVILRVRDTVILDTLQNNPKTAPYIGERLGDLAAIVRQEDWRQLQNITAQLGLLLDIAD